MMRPPTPRQKYSVVKASADDTAATNVNGRALSTVNRNPDVRAERAIDAVVDVVDRADPARLGLALVLNLHAVAHQPWEGRGAVGLGGGHPARLLQEWEGVHK